MAGSRSDRKKARLRDISEDLHGNMVYTGESYRLGSRGPAGRFALISCLVLLIAVVIGSGCLDAKNAMGAFYVILPYIGEVSALFVLAWNSLKLLGNGQVRKYVLEESPGRAGGACRMLTIFAAAGLALSAVYIARNGMGEDTAAGTAYLVLKAAAAVIAEVYRRLINKAEWELIG